MDLPKITKPTAVETFMKARTELRVKVDAAAFFAAQLDALAVTITAAAEANAKKEGRTTIMPDDVKVGMSSATGSTSDLPFLFKQLEALNAKDTAALSDLIRQWLEAH